MTDALASEEILEDANFKKLIDEKINIEEFTGLVDEHAKGYSQKKRLHDGLKDFAKKIEDAEQRIYVAKNVGKSKGPNPEDKALTTLYSSALVRQKATSINTSLEAMIEERSITHFEKSQVSDNLRGRLAKAKEKGNAKLEEKLDKMLSNVGKAGSFVLPVANIEEFHRLETEIQAIEKLEKTKFKERTKDILNELAKKPAIQADFDALKDTSRMWFETANEFTPRLNEALIAFAAAEKERKQREEEEAFQRKIQAETEAAERKRLEAAKKEEEKEKELEEKLKAKRLEAAARPVKEPPPKPQKENKPLLPPKPKEKKRDDALGQLADEKDELWEVLAQQEAERKAAEEAAAKAAQEEEDRIRAEEEAAQAAEEAELAEQEAARQKEIDRLRKQKEDAMKLKDDQLEKERQEKMKADAAAAAAKAAAPPSISLRQAAAAKADPAKLENAPKAAPKPKRKPPVEVASKWGKPAVPLPMAGEDDGEDLLERLAAQEAREKAERAAAKKAAEEEAARLAAQEEAVQEEETAEEKEKEAARQKEIERLAKQKADALERQKAAALGRPAPAVAVKPVGPEPTPTVTVKPVAKPKRSPPVERESKWGKPIAPAGGDINGDDLLEKLAAQEAQEKIERAKKAAEAAAMEKEREIAWAEKETDPVPEVTAEKTVEKPSESEPPDQTLADSLAGPSLAESLKAPKKVQAQPKKKEKKTWAKLDASAVGFQHD